MNKSKKKNQQDSTRAIVVKKVAQEMGFSEVYVRMCIKGSKMQSENAEIIKARYTELKSQLDAVLK